MFKKGLLVGIQTLQKDWNKNIQIYKFWPLATMLVIELHKEF
jgi:hypothetical protein